MSRTQKILSYTLVAVGLLQPIGYLSGITAIRGIGLASMASPLPLVFSHFRDVETFAADFDMEVTTASGQVIQQRITPALYGRLGGPYNRRNTYGAIISYGPAFNQEGELRLISQVLDYGVCKDAPLVREMGITEKVRNARIHVTNKTGGQRKTSTLEVRCTP